MITRLILFFITLVLTLGGAHFVIYHSAIKFLNIENQTIRTYLAIALLILGVSFFISTFLVRLHLNFITYIYYGLSSFWLGLLTYLLLVSAVLWIVFGITKLTGHDYSMVKMAGTLFLMALVIVLYGAWKASDPIIKNIDIKMNNLPPQWKGKKVVQLSDVHLGPIHRLWFLNDMVKKVNAQNPDLILLTGDLFDGMDGALEPFIEPLSRLKAKDGVFFSFGNHEGYLGIDESLAILNKAKIRVLQDEFIDINGLQIVGVSYPFFDHITHPEQIFESKEYDQKKATILMYHTPTNVVHKNTSLGQQQWSAYWAPDMDFSFAKKHGVDLQLSGHAHEGQFFPFNLVAKLIYGKYYYGLHNDGSFNIYISSGVGTWGPPIRIFSDSEIPVFILK